MWNEVRKTAVGACLLPRRYSLSYMTLHEEKGDNQYHQFHSLQPVEYQVLADETALSFQFHFRHSRKCCNSVSPVSHLINTRTSIL